jgi:MFS family permease
MDAPTNHAAPDALASAVRKVLWRVLPVFVVMFIVNYIDRVNVSFIKDQLRTELGIGDLAYGFGAGLFFWGYALLEVPANLALERLGARRWLTLIAVIWGLLATALAFVHNKYEFSVSPSAPPKPASFRAWFTPSRAGFPRRPGARPWRFS